MKETFIIRTEWYDAISELSPEDRLIVFDNLFLYHRGESNLINLNNLTVKLVWKLIEPDLVRNIEKYDRRCETSARNGSLGGRPRKNEKPNENLNKPNEPDGFEDKPKKADGFNEKPNNPDSDYEYEHDNDLDYDNDLKEKKEDEKTNFVFPFSSDLFFKKWNLLISTPKWKVKAPQSLQLALDKLKDYDEVFAIDAIDQAIQSEWAAFKGVVLDAQYESWKKQQKSKKSKESIKSTRFVAPTVEEVKSYCQERKNNVDPQKFIDHYQSVGWVVGAGGKKMKDWKAAVRTWEKRNFDNGKPLVNPEIIEQMKVKQEQRTQEKEIAKKIKGEVQSSVMDRLKKENPEMDMKDLMQLWDQVWKQEYCKQCENNGISKITYTELI